MWVKHLRLLRLLPSPPVYARARANGTLRKKPQKPQKAHTGPSSVRLTIRLPTGLARSKRSLERCKNPAAYGMPVCRFHGARRPDAVLRGPSHPLYRHGQETLDAKRSRVEAMTRIRALADLGVAGGFLQRRIPDRLVCHRELLLLQR